MELRIPEEGKAVYVGEDEILLAYYGSEIELRFRHMATEYIRQGYLFLIKTCHFAYMGEI